MSLTKELLSRDDERCYYVFRIDYKDFYNAIVNEMHKGMLHQGWGKSGMDLRIDLNKYIGL